MEIKCINSYSFEELETSIQDKLIEKFEFSDYTDFYNCVEIWYSLKAFFEFLDIKLIDYNLDYSSKYRSDIKIDFCHYNNYHIEELKGIRLYKYLINNYSNILPKYGPKKEINILDCWENGPLTGNCFDYSPLYKFVEYLKRPNLNLSFEELVEDCIDFSLNAIVKEYDYMNSYEYIKEELINRDYLYNSTGKRIDHLF